jgi:hypothetical protein
MQKHQMSVSDQITLTLGVLLFFSLIMIFVGVMATDQTRDKIAAFAAEGAVAAGRIVGKHIDIVRPTQGAIHVYWLDVAFATADGVARKDSAEVANTVFDRTSVGQDVEVTYVRSKPEWFYLPGGAPTARDVSMMQGMFQWGIMASVFFFISLIGWLVAQRFAV